MASVERGATSGAVLPSMLPPPDTPPEAVTIPAALLVDALAALVAAGTSSGVASACLPLLLDQPGVRACALVVRDGAHAVVLGSAGYDCGSMDAGVVLPLEAGLPVTEAIRTSRLVVHGSGPSWVAVPFGERRTGALLLSLWAAPPGSADDIARLHLLARAVGDALRRTAEQEEAVVGMSLVTAHLATSCPTAAGHEVAVRLLPFDGQVGGDVALCEPARDGGLWLVVADVCGAGLRGALTARSVSIAVTALAPYAADPEELLAGVERAIRPTIGPGSFVTAVAVLLAGDVLTVASAGHPAPLVLSSGGVAPVLLEPGEPLALETGAGGVRRSSTCALPPDAVLLLHTDGLTDRRTPAGTRDVDAVSLVPSPWDGDLESLADRVLAGAEGVGPAGDDTSLLLVRRVPALTERPMAQRSRVA